MTKPDRPDVAALSGSMRDLLEQADALRTDVHTAERARRRQNTISTAILAVLAGFVAIALVLAWQGNRTIAQTRETNERIVDCTSPGGQCYQDGSQRTGAAVTAIVWASIYMAECARQRPGDAGPEFDKFLEQCVEGKLSALTPATPPASSPSPSPSGK